MLGHARVLRAVRNVLDRIEVDEVMLMVFVVVAAGEKLIFWPANEVGAATSISRVHRELFHFGGGLPRGIGIL